MTAPQISIKAFEFHLILHKLSLNEHFLPWTLKYFVLKYNAAQLNICYHWSVTTKVSILIETGKWHMLTCLGSGCISLSAMYQLPFWKTVRLNLPQVFLYLKSFPQAAAYVVPSWLKPETNLSIYIFVERNHFQTSEQLQTLIFKSKCTW